MQEMVHSRLVSSPPFEVDEVAAMYWILEILCTLFIAKSNEYNGEAAIISVSYIAQTSWWIHEAVAALGPLNSIAQHPLFIFHIRSRIYFQEIWGTFPDLVAHSLCAFCIITIEKPLTIQLVTSSHHPDLPQTLSTPVLLPTVDHFSNPTSKQKIHTLQDRTVSPVHAI